MSTNATETNGQEPKGNEGGTEGQESQSQNGQESQEGTGQGSEFDPTTIQDPAVKAYLEKVQKDATEARQEAAKYRTERNSLKDQEAQRQRENETAEQAAQREAQERQERLDALERENRDLKVGAAVRGKAEAAKAYNPSLVATMIDAKVVLDDKGNLTNVDDLLAELRKTDSYLFKRTRTDAGDGNTGGGNDPGPTGNMNDRIREQFGRKPRTS